MIIRIVMTFVISLIPAVASPAVASPPPRPNVLVVMVDDMPAHTLWVLDDMLTELGGTIYDNAVVQHALCCPSRATFLTGQFSHNHGIVTNKGGWARFARSSRYDDHLGVWLQAAGYTTAVVGKMLNGYGGSNPELVPPGWDSWDVLVGASAYNYRTYTMNHDGSTRRYSVAGGDPIQTDHIGQLAAATITELAAGDSPWFAWITPLAPHLDGGERVAYSSTRNAHTHDTDVWRPANFGASSRVSPQRQRLDAGDVTVVDEQYRSILEALEDVDDMMVEILAALDATGERDNTIIVFTADHGFFNGEHRITHGKIVPYEEALRVPLVVSGPGFTDRIEHRLTVNADLPAFIVAAAHATAGVPLDGVPLAALPAHRAVPIYGIMAGVEYRGVRTNDEVYWTANGRAERYDLIVDPAQLVNLASSGTLDAARQRLIDDLGACSGSTCNPPAHVRAARRR